MVSDISVGARPRSVHASDLDGDGDIDIVVANQSSNTVSILRNNGDGTFGARVDYGGGSNPTGIAFGDGISDTSSNLIVRGSKFLRNSVGVRVSSVSNVSIDSCIFEDNTSDGVNFYSSNGYVRYSNFVGNGVGVRANSGSVQGQI